LPQRFKLQYRAPTSTNDEQTGLASDFQQPVIIHRAILGSVERMIAILMENFAGKWPFWLSPRQVMVIPVQMNLCDYAAQVKRSLHEAGFYADVDLSGDKMEKKIRNAEIAQYNFICVVGPKELEEVSVNVRCRDDIESKARGKTIPLTSFISQLNTIKDSKTMVSRLLN
ncbi:threonyl-tRNA synthetase, partial [Coemansia sp. RSA 2671]